MSSSKEKRLLKAVGQFFKGEFFDEPVFVVAKCSPGFNILEEDIEKLELKEEIKSVRWTTTFSPSYEGIYKFTSNSSFVDIFINSRRINENGVFLKEGIEYRLIVMCLGISELSQDDLLNLNIIQFFNGKEEVFNPDNFSIPKHISFVGMPSGNEVENLLDSDGDGIYDEWEKNGYTVIGGVVKKWDDSYALKGYKKFVSNPYESHTSGDPYSDLEKASGAIDRAIDKVAWDPLVAAYPNISVQMEKLIISNNSNIGLSKVKTISKDVSSNISNSNTVAKEGSVNAGFNVGLFNLSAFASATLSESHSDTSTQIVGFSTTEGENWQKDLNISVGQSAYINANIRYCNNGTAPIYNLRATTNLVLGDETIATITGETNQKTLSLAPNKVYPKKDNQGIALNTLDEFSSTLIPINFNQLNRLKNGEVLKLETTQFSGTFAKRNPVDGQIIIPDSDWSYYISQIEKMTARIIINLNNGTVVERRIAAKDLDNPNDLTPELTIKEALIKAFDEVKYYKKDNKLVYSISDNMLKKSIDLSLCEFIFDKYTIDLISKELIPNQTKELYNIKIRPGMNIQINLK